MSQKSMTAILEITIPVQIVTGLTFIVQIVENAGGPINDLFFLTLQILFAHWFSDFVLVAHGRWSRGFTINVDDDTKYFHLDSDEILIKTNTKPNL